MCDFSFFFKILFSTSREKLLNPPGSASSLAEMDSFLLPLSSILFSFPPSLCSQPPFFRKFCSLISKQSLGGFTLFSKKEKGVRGAVRKESRKVWIINEVRRRTSSFFKPSLKAAISLPRLDVSSTLREITLLLTRKLKTLSSLPNIRFWPLPRLQISSELCNEFSKRFALNERFILLDTLFSLRSTIFGMRGEFIDMYYKRSEFEIKAPFGGGVLNHSAPPSGGVLKYSAPSGGSVLNYSAHLEVASSTAVRLLAVPSLATVRLQLQGAFWRLGPRPNI